MKSLHPQFNAALKVAAMHLLLVFAIYFANANAGDTPSYAPMLWMILIYLDYPVSLGLAIDGLMVPGAYVWNNQTLPLLYFGIVGSLWWFLIGNVLYWLVSKIRKRRAQKRLWR